MNGTGASGYTSEVTVSTLSGAATSLASMTVSATTISEVSGQTKSVTYTALDGNGSGRPGVTVSWTVADTSVATVSPTTAVTDATGRAYAQITLGSVVAQTTLTATATDGQTGLGASQIPAVTDFILPLFTDALVKELMAEPSDPKYEDAIQPYVWDFSPYFGRGETIKRVVAVTSEPVGGAERDPASAAMIFGDARVVSTRVLQYFRDGVPGVAYLLRCRIESTIGRIVVSEIRIRIYRARGARVSSSSPVVD